jgi:hypothetical protein
MHSDADLPPDDQDPDWPDDWRVLARAEPDAPFTGLARSLAQVHIGDTVAVQVSESTGVATVVSLQDPASTSWG